MTPSVETKIWMAMKSRINTLMPAVPKAWPAQRYEPPTSGIPPAQQSYLRIGRVIAEPTRQVIASGKPHQRTGYLIITLVHKLVQSYGLEVYEDMAGSIAEHFKDGTCMSFRGVTVSVPSYPHVMEGYEEDGYWTVPVRIPWRSFS